MAPGAGWPLRTGRTDTGPAVARPRPARHRTGGYGHPRTHRLSRRTDHRHLAVHPPGATGDLLRGNACHPHRRRDARGAHLGAGRELVSRRRTEAHPLRDVASVPGDRGSGGEFQRVHVGGHGAALAAAPAAGRDSVGRTGGIDAHRSRADLPPRPALPGTPVRPHSAVERHRGQGRLRPWPGSRGAVRAVRRTGARRHHRGRRHREHRPRAPSRSPWRSPSGPPCHCWCSPWRASRSPTGSACSADGNAWSAWSAASS